MSKDTSPAAFPLARTAADDGDGWTHYGMTLRDYFAAKAMQGMLSNSTIIAELDVETQKWIAGYSYSQADAMLRVRGDE